jgi:hypothetical protein
MFKGIVGAVVIFDHGLKFGIIFRRKMRRKMRFNGEWSLLAGNRNYKLMHIYFHY